MMSGDWCGETLLLIFISSVEGAIWLLFCVRVGQLLMKDVSMVAAGISM